MKKALSIFFFNFFIISLISLVIVLSSVGIETKHFNNLISQKINSSNKNIKLNINTIKFKLDIKEISLFLETNNPQINYRKTSIPAKILKFILILFHF